MARAKERRPAFGLFAEGSTFTDPNRPKFEALWRELSARCGCEDEVRVYGFDKRQIVLLAEPPGLRLVAEPLDVLISRMHDRDRFENVVIAFDRIPANQLLPHSCLRKEVDFVLEAFGRRALLPEPFRSEAAVLRDYYRAHPGQPRGPGRPPRGPLDVVYMDPMFEGLLVHDETTVRRALGHAKRTPKDWPKFNPRSLHPDQQILAPAVLCATPEVGRKVGGTFKTNKHGWALQVVLSADPEARLWEHPIAERLKTLFA